MLWLKKAPHRDMTLEIFEAEEPLPVVFSSTV